MHSVKQAVIMAAGLGNRLRPLTLDTPKPLIEVNGVRMIDTAIRALRANGIAEIYVVAGWLKEQFRCLEEEYPGLRLIENPWYDTCNNISSLYVARDHLEDAVILEGDQIILDPAVLAPDFDRSGYGCVWSEGATRDWLITADENGAVTHCSPDGGSGGWRVCGVSRWTAEDGRELKSLLEQEFEKKQNRQIFWDAIALLMHPDQFQLTVRPLDAGGIIEIDNLTELAAVDGRYAHLAKGE